MAIKFNFFQQLFAMTPLLLRHSYSLARGCLFFLAGISFLVLTACAGGGGGSGSSGSSASAFEVELTFAPIEGGFRISNQSDFGDFVVLRITATSGENVEEEEVKTGEFVDDSYDFTGLLDLDWKFEVIGILSDGGEREIVIDFVWADNKADHDNGGIRPGANYDGDGRADSEDPDDDNDGVEDGSDLCKTGETNWMSNGSSDNDMDGCRDAGEDDDDDNDLVADSPDKCSRGETGWESNSTSDNDGDGCLDDSNEDTDDDNDGLADNHEREQQNGLGGRRCSLLADCDGDTVRDKDEVAVNCVIDADCDNDGRRDGDEEAGCVQNTDCDNDGVGDGVEARGCAKLKDCDSDTSADGTDIDDDGDGLIELANAVGLNAIRYALNGNGSKSAANAALDTTGCGGDGGITSCSGYELVADISLATYADDEGGKGWQPLGHDIDDATTGCQGTAFNGTFDGNGWTISNLSISRSGEDCVGLFGHMARGSEIRNLTLSGEAVIGRFSVGGLVGEGNSARIVAAEVVMDKIGGEASIGGLIGDGDSAQIHSSSVEVAEVEGVGLGVRIGGLVGSGENVRIHSCSVVMGEIKGNSPIGGLVGFGLNAVIIYSSVVAAEVSGSTVIGGLVGDGRGTEIISSSVVVNEVSGTNNNIGGLVGDGRDTEIISSSVVVNEVSGNNQMGGLVGDSGGARIVSSSVVVGKVSGNNQVGGLTGDFSNGKVAYSYVVLGTNTPMLVGEDSGTNGVASYWDSDTSEVTSGNIGEPKTTNALRSPIGYTDIYTTWDDNTNLFGDGNVPLAVWCDEDNSGSIESAEQTPGNLIWDFGGTNNYPAINCTPTSPAEWRSWWSLEGMPAKPQLNEMLLNNTLNP